MARPDYCPVGNEPCQSMCDEPCSWSGSKRRREDGALIQQLVEALEVLTQDYDDSAVGLEIDALAAGRAWLEGKP